MPNDSMPPDSPKVDPAEEPRRTLTGQIAPFGTQPWWSSPQVKWGLTVTIGGTAMFTHSWFGWPPALSDEKVAGLAALVTAGGGAYWLYKRIKYGNDPNSPAKKITLL